MRVGAPTAKSDGYSRVLVRRPVAAQVLALLLGLSDLGCGSSHKPLTHGQLVERASAICALALNQARGVKPPTSSGDLQAFADQAGAIVDRTARQLAQLIPPDVDRIAYNRFVAGVQGEDRALAQLASAGREGNTQQARAALNVLGSAQVNSEAAALGIPECARTVTPTGR